MRIVAVVVAGSAHALTPVVDVPMVVRAVRTLLAGAPVERVTVIASDSLRPEIERVCAGAPVDVRSPVALHDIEAHTVQREGATGSDDLVTSCGDDMLLLHDACRPLAPVELVRAVVEAVQGGHGMAVPTLPLTDTVKSVDDRGGVIGTPDRAGLRVLQTPIAVRARMVPAGACADPVAAVRRYAAAGGEVRTVTGHPAAFAVRSGWDLELAELIADGRIRL
ncbi:2-C-methyl-D-erythritol 4-phosphate cytidylyltransferase [Pseudonocardia sp. DSM 110487]|uniref:IspD/TarI family cytidylyltransferase n=1 Tax=Pseudonocardia sp. DSM 110487 TaxID=2865833 RepID=UPI001C6A7450|nr:2-C-methyl-D-erythritol 4-phosphate cytidylyltransferase [Pseudonocardia sp. DSM 110487]QYN35475.1 2-C-methyl-D-erythritol 4-phosphate cytidylyltransferase [Pseudonocardia sp. DSM 110487]